MRLDQAFQVGQRIAQGQSVGKVGLQRDGPDAIVAIQGGRIGEFLQRDQIGQRNQVAVAR